MNKIIILFVAAALLYGCGGSSGDIYLKGAPDLKLSASVSMDASGYKLNMAYENNSNDAARLLDPSCLNQSVLVTVSPKGSNEKLDQLLMLTMQACTDIVTIAPGAKQVFTLKYELGEMYGLKSGEAYTVYFEYIGGFYDGYGSSFSETILKSSAAEFTYISK